MLLRSFFLLKWWQRQTMNERRLSVTAYEHTYSKVMCAKPLYNNIRFQYLYTNAVIMMLNEMTVIKLGFWWRVWWFDGICQLLCQPYRYINRREARRRRPSWNSCKRSDPGGNRSGIRVLLEVCLLTMHKKGWMNWIQQVCWICLKSEPFLLYCSGNRECQTLTISRANYKKPNIFYNTSTTTWTSPLLIITFSVMWS